MRENEALQSLSEQGYNVLMYAGPIERRGYTKVCDVLDEIIEQGRKKDKVILYLSTYGGDPNAGYRIARALIHHYDAADFHIAIPGPCKSAGTLICIGANSLFFFDSGELGPLDVQIQKPDEIFQRNSGLDILRGMTYLQDDALTSFKRYLFDINRMGGISTKIAAEIAGNLVKGLYTPIFAQVDPLRLGEMNAALQIANEYGSRLNDKSKSLKDYALNKLTNTYPTHGFVVDRSEAKTLFHRVVPPTDEIKICGKFVVHMLKYANDRSEPFVADLCEIFQPAPSEDDDNVQPDTHQPNDDATERAGEDRSVLGNSSHNRADAHRPSEHHGAPEPLGGGESGRL